MLPPVLRERAVPVAKTANSFPFIGHSHSVFFCMHDGPRCSRRSRRTSHRLDGNPFGFGAAARLQGERVLLDVLFSPALLCFSSAAARRRSCSFPERIRASSHQSM